MSPAPPAPDLLWLLGIVFFTFSLTFFGFSSGFVQALRLSPAVWQRGLVWQVITYPFAGFGSPDFWFLLQLLILFWFGKDVRFQLGKQRFWRLLLGATVFSALVAVIVQLAIGLAGGVSLAPFVLMQGQQMLLTLLIAAFALMYRNATIYLFFVLPLRAILFVPLEILFAFMGFLSTKDLAGFLGICAGIGYVFYRLDPRAGRGFLRESRLRLEKKWIEMRLRRQRKRRRLHVVRGDEDEKIHKGPWVN